MSSVSTLVAMQLKEQLNIRGMKGKKNHIAPKILLFLIKVAIVTAILYGVLLVSKMFRLFSLFPTVPYSPIVVVFFVMLVISIISCTIKLDKMLYFSNDNPLLLTLPIKPTQVFLSKLIVFYIYEAIRNFQFMTPLFIAYGLVNGYAISYNFWVVFMTIVISALPVLIGAVLSLPMMYVYNFYRRNRAIKIGSLLIVIAVITIALFKIIQKIPADIDLIKTWGKTFWAIQDFLNEFIDKHVISDSVVKMIVGVKIDFVLYMYTSYTFEVLGIIVAILAGLLAISLLIVRPVFYKMASSPFEYKKTVVKAKENKPLPKYLSMVKNELLLVVRDSDRFFTAILSAVSLPIIIFLLNKIYASMNIRTFGLYMVISFNALLILMISMMSASFASKVFSKDGKTSYLIKVQPSKYAPLLFSKLLFEFITMTVSYIAVYYILTKYSRMYPDQVFFVVVGCYFIFVSHMLYSAEMDIMNPQTELYSTIGSIDRNPNETNSVVIAFMESLVVGLSLFALLNENPKLTFYKLFGLGLVLVVWKFISLYQKIKLYYKEK